MVVPLLALLSLRLLFRKATCESMGMKEFLQENSSYLDNKVMYLRSDDV
jgi:hypothetical protein